MTTPTRPKTKLRVDPIVSAYMRQLAYKSAQAIKGTESARIRGEKMRAGKARRRAERAAEERE
jgi:hypothetical protein